MKARDGCVYDPGLPETLRRNTSGLWGFVGELDDRLLDEPELIATRFGKDDSRQELYQTIFNPRTGGKGFITQGEAMILGERSLSHYHTIAERYRWPWEPVGRESRAMAEAAERRPIPGLSAEMLRKIARRWEHKRALDDEPFDAPRLVALRYYSTGDCQGLYQTGENPRWSGWAFILDDRHGFRGEHRIDAILKHSSWGWRVVSGAPVLRAG
jgi:hypothetical protein